MKEVVRRLTDMQTRILNALEKQVALGDVNIRALAAFGVSDTTIGEHLRAVARKGHLEFESRGHGHTPRVRLLTSGVPVVGHIAAGPLSEALERLCKDLALELGNKAATRSRQLRRCRWC